ncbi:MAG: hypothetical protein J6B60_05725 [Clostridia bacterium]|nr:hypothetical protein [Clostridia bacterium]
MEENKNDFSNNEESNSAKKLKALGIDGEDKIHSVNTQVQGSAVSNFWYHHKWKVIIGLFFIAIVTAFIVVAVTKEKYDTRILYTGHVSIYNDIEAMNDAFEKLAKDYDNNNEFKSGIAQYIYKTPEQLAKEKEEALKQGIAYNDAQQIQVNTQIKLDLNNVMLSGEFSVMLLSPAIYNECKGELREVSDVLGYEINDESLVTPDGRGIYFKNTAFAKAYDCFDSLPDDTILCLQVKIWTTDKDDYSNREDFFRAIVEYNS